MSNVNAVIWAPFEAFYINSMLFNALSAMESISRVADVMEALQTLTPDEMREALDRHSLLNELQNIVLQGGALSRYFWPSRKESAARGEQLRLGLGVADDSPLKSRSLRNALEHFDERLDDYLKRGIVGTILPEYVGRSPQNEEVPFHLFRGYFLDKGEFTLLGETYEMQPLVDEITRVYEALVFADEHGGRLQIPPAE
jgi:hypothetical protein